jgi:metal transporter CNNM
MSSAELVGRVAGAIGLLMLAALFSGLTLGVLGLDVQQLEIVKEAGTPEERRNAALIQPVRAQGNLLLCTLVLGNVAVTSLEAILLADLTSGVAGFFLTTVLVVVFGEIIPQSICARYALIIGAKAVPLVHFLICIFYPFTKPLATVLDYMLGEEFGHSYSRAEFAKLVSLQVSSKVIAASEAAIIGGALTFRSKSVKEVATPIERMFAVVASDILDYELMELIFRTGYSRVPVWNDESRTSIVGLLFAKDLVLVTPEQRQPVISVVHFFGREHVNVVDDEELLDTVLKLFISTRQHFAVVRTVDSGWGEGDPVFRISGIISYEDIMEEIIGQEAPDEFDRTRAPSRATSAQNLSALQDKALGEGRSAAASSRRRILPGVSPRLPGMDVCENGMSVSEVRATAAHLITNVRVFSNARASFSDVEALVRASAVDELGGASNRDVYKSGVATDFATVVLRGRLDINSGVESDSPTSAPFAGPWSVICEHALIAPFVPAFTARASVTAGTAVLRIKHTDFARFIATDVAALSATLKSREVTRVSVGGAGAAPLSPSSNPSRSSAVSLTPRGDLVPAEHYQRVRPAIVGAAGRVEKPQIATASGFGQLKEDGLNV